MFWFVIITINLILILMLLVSEFEIEIRRFEFDSTEKIKLKDILIYTKLKLFGKITWLNLKIDNNKIEKMKKSKIRKSKIVKKFLNKQKNIIKHNGIEIFTKLDINIKETKIKLILSLIDTIATSLSIPVVTTVIYTILSKFTKKYKKEKYIYSIIPNYSNKLIVKIQLNCIISISLVHIMNVIYILLKKGSGKDDERTSNRRAYVCGNE